MRIRISDHNTEHVVGLKNLATTGRYGGGVALAPDDSPLLFGDTGTQDGLGNPAGSMNFHDADLGSEALWLARRLLQPVLFSLQKVVELLDECHELLGVLFFRDLVA